MSTHKNRNILTLKPEQGYPCSVDWSPDSTRLVIGDSKGGIEVLTAEGQRMWRRQEHTDYVRGVSWSPNGQKIATASSGNNTISVLDAASGNVLIRDDAGTGNWKITWSPDSNRLAWYVQSGGTLIVRIADSTTGQSLIDCTGHTQMIWCVSWSPTGKMLASGAGINDYTVRIWDTQTGSCLHCLEGHSEDVMDLSWAPDSLRLASASDDKTVRIWDIKTGQCVLVCEGHQYKVWSVSWSPDGRLLASGSLDKTVRLWDADSGAEALLFSDHTDSVYSVAFSPDSTRLASASTDGTLRIWDVSDLVQSRAIDVRSVGLDAYVARQAATVGRRSHYVEREVWTPHLPEAEGDCLGVLSVPFVKYNIIAAGVALFHNSQSMLTSIGDEEQKARVCSWDLVKDKQIWIGNQQHNDVINDIAMSPNEVLAASASSDKTVRIWDTGTGACKHICKGHNDLVYSISWSPDGHRLASASDDGTVRVWNAHSGQCLLTIPSHARYVKGVSCSPNGKYLASSADCSVNDDYCIKIWDAHTGVCLHQYFMKKECFWYIQWSPSSRYITVGGYVSKDVLVIDAERGSILLRGQGHKNKICSVVWSHNERFLTSVDYDGVVIVWSVQTGKELKRFSAEVRCWRVAWSHDNAFLVSTHEGNMFRFWNTRDLLSSQGVKVSVQSPDSALPAHLRLLPSASGQMHRMRIYPPISLVHDLLNLLGGKTVDGPVGGLMKTNCRKLVELRWPSEARIGLAALLMRKLPAAEKWMPPSDVSLTKVRDALAEALKGQPIEPDAPAPPMSLLTEAAKTIDNRLFSMLTILGPEAVAAEPALPLQMLPKVKSLPPLSREQRRLLGVNVSVAGVSGRSVGSAPGAERGQIGGIELGRLKTDWSAMLPTQLVLPKKVQVYRHIRGELLFRAREIAEPPRLRPTVLVLDVSPPAYGPVEGITRLAAYTVARSLRKAGLTVALITTGNDENLAGQKQEWGPARAAVRELEHQADLMDIWTHRTLCPANAPGCLKLANAVRASLCDDSGLEPAILLLTHPWFGSDDEIPPVKNLRGLFVQYPKYQVHPALAESCEKWQSLNPGQTDGLSEVLGNLIG